VADIALGEDGGPIVFFQAGMPAGRHRAEFGMTIKDAIRP
jgi:hypothetical protein